MALKEKTEEEFGKRVDGMIENGFSCLSLGIGFKLKLFDVLGEVTSQQHPKTSQEIASAAGLRERYVREWLGAMVCADVVEVDAGGTHYHIPQHRLSQLHSSTRGPLSFGAYLSMFGNVSDKILDCFKPSGPRGLSYDEFGDFHEFMANISDRRNNEHLIKDFLPQVPGLVPKLQTGIKCLDIGCGRGLPSYLMGEAFPNSEFWGVDFSREAVAYAEDRVTKAGMRNVHYVEMDAEKLNDNWTDMFDYITCFDSVHDQSRPDLCLREVDRVLKKDGVLSVFDIGGTSNPYEDKNGGSKFAAAAGYTLSLLHCMPVSLFFEGGMGLGACWGRKRALKLFAENGFHDVTEVDVDYCPYNTHFICNKR